MDKPQETIEDFIKRIGITFRAERVPSRSDRGAQTDDERAWDERASHWRVSFELEGKKMAAFYSMGEAHAGPPSGPEVLDALLSDAESWDNARRVIKGPNGERKMSAPDVDTFAREYGYDDDGAERSIYGAPKRERLSLIQRADRVRRIFNACGRVYRGLSRLLGAERFDALRACERL